MSNQNNIISDIEAWLRFMKNTGVSFLPGSPVLMKFLGKHPEKADKLTTKQRKGSAFSGAQKDIRIITDISVKPHKAGEDEKECSLCSLSATREGVVKGRGPHPAEIMLIGSYPSREDERKGMPFSGAVGELLSKMLRAININPESVYMTNLLKCRPPQGHLPTRKEFESCKRLLEHELEIVSPAFLLLLGEMPARFFSGEDKDLSSVMGNMYDKEGYRVMAIHHPAFLLGLSGPEQMKRKKEAWVALQKFERSLRK